MVKLCSVLGCSTGNAAMRKACREENLIVPSIFLAPKDAERFKQWKNIFPYLKNGNGICELHFRREDILNSFVLPNNDFLPRERKSLKAFAVPFLDNAKTSSFPVEGNDMDRKKVYKIIPVEFDEIVDGAYVLNSPDGEQYKLTGENFPTKKGSLIRLDKNTFLRLMNDIEEDDLEEIVILNDEEEDDTEIKQYGDLNVSINKEKEPATWPEEPTRNLIQMYKLLKPLVDKAEIKTMKQMWEKISDSLKKNGFNYDYQQVESKWKSLVRSYKVVSQQGSKRKSCLAGPFEKELGEILSKTNYIITSPEKDAESIDVPSGPSDKKKLKLDIEEIISNGTNLNSNTTEINAALCRIAKAIETETFKREKIEERKLEQRERLIQAIEKGNGLLIKLLIKK